MRLIRTLTTVTSIVLALIMNSASMTASAADDSVKELLEGIVSDALHKKGLKPPKQISPTDFQQFTHYPRQLTLIWEGSSKRSYDVEIDCNGCRQSGQWDSDGGSPLHSAKNIKAVKYDFVFVGDNQGRWRVRAIKGDKQGKWSPWSHFKFNTAAGSGSDTNYNPQGDYDQGGTPPPDYGNGSGQSGGYPPQDGSYPPAGPGQAAVPGGSGGSSGYEQPYPGGGESGNYPGETGYPGGQGDPNYDPNQGSGYDPNYDPNQGSGYDPNQGSGYDPQPDPDQGSGYDPQYDPNYDPNQGAGQDPNAGGQAPGDSGGSQFGVTRVAPTLGVFVVKEDCVSFNPQSAKVAKRKGRWKIVDGKQWVFDFNKKKKEANRSLKIIKYYGVNQSCFVGRPGPSFRYLLKSGKSPSGKMSKEDCTSFKLDNIKVAKRKGRWKIVDGKRWVFDFGGKQKEANKALAIIKRHKFSRSCFVGRPGPSLSYLRR
ncbi:MAG: hypothetical protein GXP09_00130 [Gammaproteobacteria bacterium]|nr:hypothetical protein [Gammaproteobacteria bacterium]